MAALPAEAADDYFLNSIISAPLFYTHGVNTSLTHFESTKSVAFFPLTSVALMSGYIVGEWFPQTTNLWMSVTLEPVFKAS